MTGLIGYTLYPIVVVVVVEPKHVKHHDCADSQQRLLHEVVCIAYRPYSGSFGDWDDSMNWNWLAFQLCIG